MLGVTVTVKGQHAGGDAGVGWGAGAGGELKLRSREGIWPLFPVSGKTILRLSAEEWLSVLASSFQGHSDSWVDSTWRQGPLNNPAYKRSWR